MKLSPVLKKSLNREGSEHRSLLQSTDESTTDPNATTISTFVVSDTPETVENDESDTGDSETDKNVEEGEQLVDAEPTDEKELTPVTWQDKLKRIARVIKGFPLSYWLVVTLTMLFISDLYTTTAFLTQYLYPLKLLLIYFLLYLIGVLFSFTFFLSHDDWQFDPESASVITSLVCLSNVITSPLAGWLAGYPSET